MAISRRKFIRSTSACAASMAMILSDKIKPKQGFGKSKELPNIVIIMTDQQRSDYTKSEGFPLDTQPFLDSLRKRGVGFKNAYTTAPACAPARCSLLTGRFPHAHRVRENSGLKNVKFTRDLVDVLKEKGYRMGLAGKNHSYLKQNQFDFWHQHAHWSGHSEPTAPGYEKQFDKWLLELVDAIGKQPTPFPLEAQQPYRIVSSAMDFADTPDERPFFLWLSFPQPHNPYQVPEPYFDMFPPEQVPDRIAGPDVLENKSFKWKFQRKVILKYIPDYENQWRRVRSNYCGMLRLIDDQVKRFVTHLEKTGKMQNTQFVFISDHGDFVGDYGMHKKGVEMPECLVHVPMFWTGPGVKPVPEGTDDFVSIADIMPTMCEMVSVPFPEGVQGRSLWPLLTGEPYPKEEFKSIYAENGNGGLYFDESDELSFDHMRMKRPIKDSFDELNSYSQSGYLKMVRMGDWKLCFDMMGNGQLYNLITDPAETKNLFDDSSVSNIQKQLLGELLKWTIRTEDVLPTYRYIHKWPVRNWYSAY